MRVEDFVNEPPTAANCSGVHVKLQTQDDGVVHVSIDLSSTPEFDSPNLETCGSRDLPSCSVSAPLSVEAHVLIACWYLKRYESRSRVGFLAFCTLGMCLKAV